MAFEFGKQIKLKGDWKEFDSFLKYKWEPELKRAVDDATGRSAMYILSEIRRRIHDREYTSNALATALKKGFSSANAATPLVDSGKLIREALDATRIREWIWQVGILKNVQYPGGAKVKDIVPTIHDGATIVIQRGDSKVIIRIPPRRFLKEVWNDPKVVARVQKEWHDAVQMILRKYGKL